MQGHAGNRRCRRDALDHGRVGRALVDAGRAERAAYFVQDYEPWFYPEEDAARRARVRQTYELISHKIVTSEWLRDLIARRRVRVADDPARVGYRVLLSAARSSAPVTPGRAGDGPAPNPSPGVRLRGGDAREGPRTRCPMPRSCCSASRSTAWVCRSRIAAPGVVTDHEELARLYSSARCAFRRLRLPGVRASGARGDGLRRRVGAHRRGRRPRVRARTERTACWSRPDTSIAAAAAILRLLSDDRARRASAGRRIRDEPGATR